MPLRNPPSTPYPGEIREFASLVLPFGWYGCDGGEMSRSTCSDLFKAVVNQQEARVNVNSNTMICTDTTKLVLGAFIVCPGVPTGTRITSLSAPTTVGMSANATQTYSLQQTTFHLWGLGNGSTTFNRPDFRGRGLIGSGQRPGGSSRNAGDSGGAETHTLIVAETPEHDHGLPDGGGDTARNFPGGFMGTQSIYNYAPKSQKTGGGQAHNNMQPFSVVQIAIYAGV